MARCSVSFYILAIVFSVYSVPKCYVLDDLEAAASTALA